MSWHQTCPHCGGDLTVPPPEPPPGSWVKDRFGGTAQRHPKDDPTQHGSWSQPGFMYLANWSAMWQARGPLTPCGPWGADL